MRKTRSAHAQKKNAEWPLRAAVMAPSISKEELMRHSEVPLFFEIDGTAPPSKVDRSQRIWEALNSRCANFIIVIFVFIESVIILSQLLMDLQIIQVPCVDSDNPPLGGNCTMSGNSAENQIRMANATTPSTLWTTHRIRHSLGQTSLVILTVFVIEVFMRIIFGRSKFLSQGVEVLDSGVSIMTFALDVSFILHPWPPEKRALLLMILLRLWRIRKIVDSIVEFRNLELTQLLNEFEHEKAVAENKGEVLILRVEDLEHEVAYLKEKLKKTEKENAQVPYRKQQHRKFRDSSYSSLTSCYKEPPHQVTVGVETTSRVPICTLGTQTLPSVCEYCGVSQNLPRYVQRFTDALVGEALTQLVAPPVPNTVAPDILSPPSIQLTLNISPKSWRSTPRSSHIMLCKERDSPESGYSGYTSSGGSIRPACSLSPYESLSSAEPPTTASSYYSRGSKSSVFLFPEQELAALCGGGGRRTDSLESGGPCSVEMSILDEECDQQLQQHQLIIDNSPKPPMTSL